jgi:hypothetical protein
MHEIKKGSVVVAYECPSCDYVIPLVEFRPQDTHDE